MNKLHINSQRLQQRLADLAKIGQISETGVCRLALTEEDRLAVKQVQRWMQEAGLSTRIDNLGNLIGKMEGKNTDAPILMLGSHIDSQPYAGRFDGTIGVLGGLEVLHTLIENDFKPEMSIELVAFCDEEGSRFNKGLFGSRGMLGQLEDGELDRKDKDGITRREALIQFGCDPQKIDESIYPQGSIATYLELHIEQGPVLDTQEEAIGIVTGIAGPLWLTVELKGFAGHAGSVPMPLRKDALVGAAHIIVALNELVRSEENAPIVATVGQVNVFPNSVNIIPEQVNFTIDLRDIDLHRRQAYEEKLRLKIEQVAEEQGLEYKIIEDTNSEPCFCAEGIKAVMREEGEQLLGYPLTELMSGPFHDALVLSSVCDYGMIFVRSKDGISHNPLEYSSAADIALGTELLYRTVLRLATQ